jgi:hypothetical protein
MAHPLLSQLSNPDNQNTPIDEIATDESEDASK